MKIDGACHCGAITYEAEIDPAGVRLCHCTDCQTLSGSAFRVTVSAADGSFVLLSGEPTIYIKTAESGAKRAHAFCEDCGTPIYATSAATVRRNTACASEPSASAPRSAPPGSIGAVLHSIG